MIDKPNWSESKLSIETAVFSSAGLNVAVVSNIIIQVEIIYPQFLNTNLIQQDGIPVGLNENNTKFTQETRRRQEQL